MMYRPFNYDEINALAGHYAPSSVKAFNNLTFAYWERSLFQRAVSKIETILPENWEGKRRDFLLYCLLKLGFVFVSMNDTLGYWFNFGQLSGIDFYYQPVTFILANPRAKDVGIDKTNFKIGVDGQLLKFMPDYTGIFDTISYYAEKLSTLDCAINTSIINCKVPFIIGGKNRAAVQVIKKLLDKVNKGEPAVFYDQVINNDQQDSDNPSPFQFIELQKLNENYVLDKQLIDFQTILNAFDAEIGINTVPYQKKERFVSAEADSRQNDSQARITTAIECLKSSVKDIKKLYPDITLDFNLREEVSKDVNRKDDANRTEKL